MNHLFVMITLLNSSVSNLVRVLLYHFTEAKYKVCDESHCYCLISLYIVQLENNDMTATHLAEFY